MTSSPKGSTLIKREYDALVERCRRIENGGYDEDPVTEILDEVFLTLQTVTPAMREAWVDATPIKPFAPFEDPQLLAALVLRAMLAASPLSPE